MDEEEPIRIVVTVVCKNDSCYNYNKPIVMEISEGEQVVCGPCGSTLEPEAGSELAPEQPAPDPQ